jgi:hypothetical protein
MGLCLEADYEPMVVHDRQEIIVIPREAPNKSLRLYSWRLRLSGLILRST